MVTFRLANLLRRSDIGILLCVCWLDEVVLLVHCCVLQISGLQGAPLFPVSSRTLQFFAISAMDVDHIDTHPARAVVNFQCSGGSIVPAKVPGPSEPGASQDGTDSHVSSLTSVESGLPSGVEEDSDSASDTEIVSAKSVCGVWGLANVFANGKLYFTRSVPEANCLPQGLEAPAKPPAKPAPKAAKPHANPSTKSAAKPAAHPAAGEPIPVAPESKRPQKKWHTEPVSK